VRRPLAGLLLTALALAGAVLFFALGVWQLERRQWKLALIAQVDRKLAAAPIAAPAPPQWPRVGDSSVYTRVRVEGRWEPRRNTYVQAVTDLGGGFWVLTPLRTQWGHVLVNRGFIPPEQRDHVAPPIGEVAVTGLLRLTEPRGGFLRSNDPAADRWYSRDVAAIAQSRRLVRVAPYFIDADATPQLAWPRGGLTTVRFRNSHLVYALTWFSLAALSIWMLVRVVRDR
jgi:surfeit locus 1 family protein